MLIRQSLNFAVHVAAGLAFGALTVAALARQRRRWDGDLEPEPAPEPAAPPPTAPPPRRPGASA